MTATGYVRPARYLFLLIGVASLALFGLGAPQPAAANLSVAVEASPDPVRPGEAVNVRITVSNDGSTAETNVKLESEIPANINASASVVTALTLGGTCPATVINNGRCDPGEFATWALGTIPAGRGVTVSYPAVIAAGTADGTLVPFEAVVSDLSGPRASDTRSVEVLAAPFFELALEESRDPVAAGGELVYTLRFGHVATARVAPSTVLSIDLPAGVSFVSATDGGTLAANTVEWSLGTLSASVSGQRQVTVQVDDPGLIDDGDLLAAEADVADTDDGAARARSVTRVDGSTPLNLALVARPDPARPGELVIVEATVSNAGLIALAGVGLGIRMPDEQGTGFLVTTLSGGGTCLASVNNNGRCDSRELATWSLGTIPAGGGVTVTLPFSVAAGTADAALISLDAVVGDSSGLQRSAQRTLTVHSASRLELAVEEDRDPAAAGEELTYSLRFGQVATAQIAPGAVLSFELPAGASFVSATDGGTFAGNSVEWSLGTLLPGVASQRQVTLQVDPGLAEGTLLETQSRIADTAGAEARARTVTRVEADVPLNLALVVGTDPARPTELVLVEATVTNPSGLPAAGVVLEIRLPEGQGTGSLGATLSGGGTCPATFVNNGRCDVVERATWNLGTIPAGGGVTVTLPVTVASVIADATLITFDAHVADGADAQRTLQRTIHVDSAPAFELSLAEDRDPVNDGESLTYTLYYGHVASARFAPGTVLTLDLPANVSFVSATDGGVPANGSVEWALGMLAPGASGRLQASVAVDAGLTDGSLLNTQALISDTDSPAEQARARVATRVEGGVPLELDLVALPDPVAPDQVIGVQATVTNAGALPVAGVLLEVRIPENVVNILNSALSTGGSCPAAVINNSRCDASERATWSLGILAPGQSVTVTLPPPVTGTTPEATLVTFDAHVKDDTEDVQRTLQRSVIVDNCPFVPNPSQQNSDGKPRGDACLCGDQTGNGVVDVSDLVAINIAIFNPGQVTPLCDTNRDGACNVQDIVGANVEIFSPGETAICVEQPCTDIETSCP